jgi:hypothetical protein
MKIIYPNPDNTIAILMPCECGLTIEQIAQKDVPYNTPYLIVEDSDLPEDWSNSAAWEADFSDPDGIGVGAQRYFIAQAEAKIAALESLPEPVQIEGVSDEDHAAVVALFNAQRTAMVAEQQAIITQMEAELA